jgi:hypothetical protein
MWALNGDGGVKSKSICELDGERWSKEEISQPNAQVQ